MNYFENQRTLGKLYELTVEEVRSDNGLSRAEFDVLMFLANNPQYKTAASIVKTRRLAKSQVSAAVDELASKGLITTKKLKENKKNVILNLTEKGILTAKEGKLAQKSFFDKITEGFTERDLVCFKGYIDKILSNAKKGLSEI